MISSNPREIWFVHFGLDRDSGEPPRPKCLAACELKSGRNISCGQIDLTSLSKPPYPIDSDSIAVMYYASDAIGCHFELGWAAPHMVLDLYPEFRNATNGLPSRCGNGLLGACLQFGVGADILARLGGQRAHHLPSSDCEQQDIDDCKDVVEAIRRLFLKMEAAGLIDLDRALQRGRFMTSVARMERNGIPIDVQSLEVLRSHWSGIQDSLIARMDKGKVYDGRRFVTQRFIRLTEELRILWPRLESGAPALDDDTLKEMALLHPEIHPYRELRHAMSQLRLNALAIGRDGRNRSDLAPFKAKTSRNQPSNSSYILGLPSWLRYFIKPAPGMAFANLDYEQQEFGAAAGFSGDSNMMQAYFSGDPYLSFAKQAGAIPQDGTRNSHSEVRERYKTVILATQYGMGARGLAQRLGIRQSEAVEMLRQHREVFSQFWRWSDGMLDSALLNGRLNTVFGWNLHVNPRQVNPRSLRNFPLQGNGAEILRIACCLATEAGLRICAPLHDAIFIEAPLDEIDEAVRCAQNAMAEASRIVLGGMELRTDAKITRYPDRYQDPRGRQMWKTVWEIIKDLDPMMYERAGVEL